MTTIDVSIEVIKYIPGRYVYYVCIDSQISPHDWTFALSDFINPHEFYFKFFSFGETQSYRLSVSV